MVSAASTWRNKTILYVIALMASAASTWRNKTTLYVMALMASAASTWKIKPPVCDGINGLSCLHLANYDHPACDSIDDFSYFTHLPKYDHIIHTYCLGSKCLVLELFLGHVLYFLISHEK